MPRLEVWYTAQYLAGTLPDEFAGMRLGEVQKEMDERGLENNADLMLGLPRETLTSHIESIYTLVDDAQNAVLRRVGSQRDEESRG